MTLRVTSYKWAQSGLSKTALGSLGFKLWWKQKHWTFSQELYGTSRVEAALRNALFFFFF